MNSKIVLWKPQSSITLPPSLKTPNQIAQYAKQLTERELNQVVAAFDAGNYEMGSLFLWSKTMAGLKKQLSSLGMEFIGEMLDRSDISSKSSASAVLTDYEAVKLAEELGMFNATQSMRIRRVLEMISHFSNPPEEEEDEEDREMMPEEATLCLRMCVQSVLGHDRLEGAIEFAKFRKELEEKTFGAEDDEIQSLITSPYFFKRTTLRVLLTLAKTSEGAQLENALANLFLIVPLLWKGLLHSDRWIIGRAYAEVHSDGKKSSASGLRRALLKVKGFDYVPEDLRSRAFLSAASNIQNVHFARDNYYNEPSTVRELALLGSVIPIPAVAQCITSILCVRLGRPWGISWAAQEPVNNILKKINESRWNYYLNECLPGDEVILGKLQEINIAKRWCKVVKEHNLDKVRLKKKNPRNLVSFAANDNYKKVISVAEKMYKSLTAVEL